MAAEVEAIEDDFAPPARPSATCCTGAAVLAALAAGQWMREDGEFAAEAQRYGMPLRRLICVHGRSFVVGPPVEQRGIPIADVENSTRREDYCACGCGAALPATRLLYASAACCRRAEDARRRDARRDAAREDIPAGPCACGCGVMLPAGRRPHNLYASITCRAHRINARRRAKRATREALNL